MSDSQTPPENSSRSEPPGHPAAAARPGDTASSADAVVPPPGAVAVTVVRTGGFAGLTRTWVAEPPRAATAFWVTLIAECPWDEPVVPVPAAHRFVWQIDAITAGDHHRAHLGERDVRGPWRTLIDAVQTAADAPT